MMRLDRLLCEAGFGSRSHVKVLVKKGLVQVNGEKAERPEHGERQAGPPVPERER